MEYKTMPELDKTPRKDFFISYNSADRLWAEWIAWQLEKEGYSVVLQSRDFRPGQNFVQSMQNAIKDASRAIAVLSPDYLDVLEKDAEWITILRPDPTNEQGILLPVQVRECRDQLRTLLPFIVYTDLVGRNEQDALRALLTGIRRVRSKPLATLDRPAIVEHTITEQPRFPATLPAIWKVPPRNPFFTGRDEILQRLHASFAALNMQELTQPQAISGLGGIGKTQIAIEYAYRYSNEYQAVLWVPADSHDALVTSYLTLAHLLDLKEKDAHDHNEIISAVRNWLQDHVDWLLILDNSDDPYIVRDFLPSVPKGDVLMTTRAQAVGRMARGVAVDTMTPDEGALFLLRRAGMLGPRDPLNTSDPEYQNAMHIAQIMDGLPLALDQAGAYIEEVGCSISDYLTLYKTHHKNLLWRRGGLIFDHPEPVATTWALSFEHVRQDNPKAAELLRLCAFLFPDEIPEEILIEATTDLGFELNALANNQLAINDAIAELRKYSLVRRHPENKTLSMHRLVQMALIDTMDEATTQQWAERTVHLINSAFPYIEFENWTECERVLPHALRCADWIERYHLTFPEGTRLLNQTGYYLSARARYYEAEPLLQRALAIVEQQLGPSHPDTAISLNNLASLYRQQGKLDEAEPLLQRALAIVEQQLGPSHPSTATTLNNLASLYQDQGKLNEAEPLLQRALAIDELTYGPNHPEVATDLNNLARLYRQQGKLAKAEPLYLRALSIVEQQLGLSHPYTIISLNNLASLYQQQSRLNEAEPLLQRALSIREQQLGSLHPTTAISLNNLASLYWQQNKFAEAEPLLQRALIIDEQQLGSLHPTTATSLNNLASLYWQQNKFAEAEPLLKRALTIDEHTYGPDHPYTATSLNNLARLYQQQGKLNEAESLAQRAFSIREPVLGSDHPDIARSLSILAQIYTLQGKLSEAEFLCRRAFDIFESALGAEHPDTVNIQHHLDSLLREKQQPNEAERHIGEKQGKDFETPKEQ